MVTRAKDIKTDLSHNKTMGTDMALIISPGLEITMALVVAQATHISMTLVSAWPLDTNMVLGG